MYYDNKNRIIQEKISSPVDVGKNGKTIDYVYYDPNVRRGKKVKAVITNVSTTDSIVTTMIYNRTALPVLKIENSDSIVYQYAHVFHLKELFLFEFLSPDNRSVWHY